MLQARRSEREGEREREKKISITMTDSYFLVVDCISVDCVEKITKSLRLKYKMTPDDP